MIENPDDKPYPRSICSDCGARYGRRTPELATWHEGTCDICGFANSVTEPRDFGHLNKGWERHVKHPSLISKSIMTNERYSELMKSDTLRLTDDERSHGWHFCVEMDGLLRNNNEEGEGWKCGCLDPH